MPYSALRYFAAIHFALLSLLTTNAAEPIKPAKVNDGFSISSKDWPWWRGPDAMAKHPPIRGRLSNGARARMWFGRLPLQAVDMDLSRSLVHASFCRPLMSQVAHRWLFASIERRAINFGQPRFIQMVACGRTTNRPPHRALRLAMASACLSTFRTTDH